MRNLIRNVKDLFQTRIRDSNMIMISFARKPMDGQILNVKGILINDDR